MCVLWLQSSVEVSSDRDVSSGSKEEPKISLTFSQLVFNFDSIFRGIAKREGLNDPCHIAIGVNQIKTFLDEFGKARLVFDKYDCGGGKWLFNHVQWNLYIMDTYN